MIARHIRHLPHRRGFPTPPPASRLYRNIAVTFLVCTVVVVGIAIWMSTVRAKVSVRVVRDTSRVETSVEVAEQPGQGQLRGRIVEGTFDKIREFEVAETSTSEVIATTTGRVRITNRYSKDQPLIATTRLLTPDGKLFRISRSVTAPSGGSVDVEAFSNGTGNDFLIAKGTTFTIPGLWIDLQRLITAEALADFQGGAGADVKIATQGDVDGAIAKLEQEVLANAKRTLAAEAGIPEREFEGNCTNESGCWMGVYVVKTVEKKTNVTTGQTTDAFLAQVKLNVTAVFYQKTDMEALIRAKIKERLPEGRELVDLDPSRVIFKLEEADAGTKTARISLFAEASSRLTEQSPLLSKESIAGLSVEDAKAKILDVQGTESVEITLRPSWARSLPTETDKIEMKIE